MIDRKTSIRIALIASLGLLPAACAKQPDQSGMQGMDMQTMMKQCADMRQQMAQGTHSNSPEMAQMMAHCDEMDRSMGGMPGKTSSAPAAAPAATRSR